jgi:hypothetical protein
MKAAFSVGNRRRSEQARDGCWERGEGRRPDPVPGWQQISARCWSGPRPGMSSTSTLSCGPFAPL